MSSASFDALWEEALQHYLTTAGRDRMGIVETLKILHSTTDLEAHLASDQEKFACFRQRRYKFFAILKKTVKPLESISNTSSSFISQTPYAPVSVVLTVVLYVMKAADDVSRAYDWIEQLLENLQAFSERLEQYVTVGLNEQLKTKVIAILGCLLEVLAISEKYVKDGRFKRYTVAIFLGEDKGVQGAFERLSKLFVSEERLVVAILYANGQKTFEICRGSRKRPSPSNLIQQGSLTRSDRFSLPSERWWLASINNVS
jgi:fungal STAND N-terminal Goodbye domain